MNDRWRMKNRVDQLMMGTIPCEKENKATKIIGRYREIIFFRKSRLEEVKEKYGDKLEVIC